MSPPPLVLFDGECLLCDAVVTFLLAHDGGALRFASLQSEAGQRALEVAGFRPPSPAPESVLLVEAGRVFARSTAALRIARSLEWPYRWLGALSVVPRPLRDAVYDWVARHRTRWFGRSSACRAQSAETRARFIG